MQPDTQIARYKILGELGQGGMGVVYKAYDPNLDRVVALKTLKLSSSADDETFEKLRKRFVLEARIAANLSHPNIVVVHDFGVEPELRRLFLAMELLEGETGDKAVRRRGALSTEEVLIAAQQLASALAHAHQQGVIHRDIKPSNLMFMSAGRLKVLDFGIAKMAEYQVTVSGEFVGSPAFCSPEQLSGQTVDHRSDLFAVGSVMFYLLCAKRPYKSEKINDLLLEMVYGEPRPLLSVAPNVPPKVVDIVTRLMAREPDARFQSSQELAEALAGVLQGYRRDTIPIQEEDLKDIPMAQKTFKMRAVVSRRPKLQFLSGQQEGKVVALEKAEVVVGRRQCDVVVPDREVSGNHCILVFSPDDDGECILRDLDSKNGTWVEGRKVDQVHLASGATFKVGQTEMRLLLEPDVEPRGPVPQVREAAQETPSPIVDEDAPGLAPAPFEAYDEQVEAGREKKEEAAQGKEVDLDDDNPTTMMDIDVRSLVRKQKKKAAPRERIYKLEIVEGLEQGKVFELTELRNVIGRQDCEIVLKDTRVSRKHAEIEIKGMTTVYLRDLASTNGTFLNDVEVTTVQLKSNDVVKVGSTRMKFVLHART